MTTVQNTTSGFTVDPNAAILVEDPATANFADIAPSEWEAALADSQSPVDSFSIESPSAPALRRHPSDTEELKRRLEYIWANETNPPESTLSLTMKQLSTNFPLSLAIGRLLIDAAAAKTGKPAENVVVTVAGPRLNSFEIMLWLHLGATVYAVEPDQSAASQLELLLEKAALQYYQRYRIFNEELSMIGGLESDIVMWSHPHKVTPREMSYSLKAGGILIIQTDMSNNFLSPFFEDPDYEVLFHKYVDPEHYFIPSIFLQNMGNQLAILKRRRSAFEFSVKPQVPDLHSLGNPLITISALSDLLRLPAEKTWPEKIQEKLEGIFGSPLPELKTTIVFFIDYCKKRFSLGGSEVASRLEIERFFENRLKFPDEEFIGWFTNILNSANRAEEARDLRKRYSRLKEERAASLKKEKPAASVAAPKKERPNDTSAQNGSVPPNKPIPVLADIVPARNYSPMTKLGERTYELLFLEWADLPSKEELLERLYKVDDAMGYVAEEVFGGANFPVHTYRPSAEHIASSLWKWLNDRASPTICDRWAHELVVLFERYAAIRNWAIRMRSGLAEDLYRLRWKDQRLATELFIEKIQKGMVPIDDVFLSEYESKDPVFVAVARYMMFDPKLPEELQHIPTAEEVYEHVAEKSFLIPRDPVDAYYNLLKKIEASLFHPKPPVRNIAIPLLYPSRERILDLTRTKSTQITSREFFIDWIERNKGINRVYWLVARAVLICPSNHRPNRAEISDMLIKEGYKLQETGLNYVVDTIETVATKFDWPLEPENKAQKPRHIPKKNRLPDANQPPRTRLPRPTINFGFSLP